MIIGTKTRTRSEIKSKPLGCSLLFCFEERGRLVGVKKSYVLKLDAVRVDKIVKSAYDKAQLEITQFSPGYKYIGIEDIYSVVGFSNEGSFLGRTSYYEYNTSSLAKSLVQRAKDYSLEGIDLQQEINYFNVTLAFFYKDAERMGDSFAFTAITIVKASQVKEGKIKSKEIGMSERFKKKIAMGSIDNLQVAQIKFLGIHDMYPVGNEIKKGGSYQTFYNKRIRSINELKDQILNKDEINKKTVAIRERIDKLYYKF